jgi:hypothetical protein
MPALRRHDASFAHARAALARFVEAEGCDVLAEFVEVETGKGADAIERRPPLHSLGSVIPMLARPWVTRLRAGFSQEHDWSALKPL